MASFGTWAAFWKTRRLWGAIAVDISVECWGQAPFPCNPAEPGASAVGAAPGAAPGRRLRRDRTLAEAKPVGLARIQAMAGCNGMVRPVPPGTASRARIASRISAIEETESGVTVSRGQEGCCRRYRGIAGAEAVCGKGIPSIPVGRREPAGGRLRLAASNGMLK